MSFVPGSSCSGVSVSPVKYTNNGRNSVPCLFSPRIHAHTSGPGGFWNDFSFVLRGGGLWILKSTVVVFMASLANRERVRELTGTHFLVLHTGADLWWLSHQGRLIQ